MSKLSRSEASIIFKLHTRIINLKKNSEISINTISYAHDAKKRRWGRTFMWKVREKIIIHEMKYTEI